MEQFIMKTKIYMGRTALDRITELPVKTACIICDPYMKTSGKVDVLTKILDGMNVKYDIFADVIPEPTTDVVAAGVDAAVNNNPDTFIALGGGSAIDTAKAIRYVYSTMKDFWPSLVAVPTTSGTGSEVTSFAVVTDSTTGVKYPIVDNKMIPDVALLDPNLTVTVPKKVTADTGMDVLTHVFEAFVSTRACDFTDAFSEKAIKLIWKYLPVAVNDGSNFEAREHVHNASCIAGVAFNSAGLGICHSLAHAMGAVLHLPHGTCNAILLPHIIEYNAGLRDPHDSPAVERYAEIARVLGINGPTAHTSVNNLLRELKLMMRHIGIPEKITELNITKEVMEENLLTMAQNALADVCTTTNPKQPSVEDIKAIYRKLY